MLDSLLSIVMPLVIGLLLTGAVALVVVTLWPHEFLAETQRAAADGSVLKASRSVFVGRLAGFNARFLKREHHERFRRAYVAAGQPGTLDAPEFVAIIELSTLAFLVFGWIVLQAVEASYSLLAVFAVIGVVLPVIWLRDLVKKRHFHITRRLPYALDLLTLSVEAGLDFAGALGKVVEKTESGPLTDELAITLNEMKMGKTREESLRNLADRVDLAALSTFVSSLIQADRMGTPLGRVLRIQSNQLRVERTQRAEKLANEAPVKMLFPLILCIFPTVFMILFGPIVFQFTFGKL